MNNFSIAIALLFFLNGCGAPSADAVADEFHYEDLAAFEQTMTKIAEGAEPEAAYAEYMAAASSGFQGWTRRYNVSPEQFVSRVNEHREIFQRLPDLEDDLRAREPIVREGLRRLRTMASSTAPLPVYYFISSQHQLAGTPVALDEKSTHFGIGVALGIDFSPTPNESANPDTQPFDESAIADLLVQLVAHEGAHILQIGAQGGIDNYRSIYGETTGSMLAIAVREGCAEYITFLATGLRFGERHIYLAENEKALWREFKTIADAPPFSVPGWFSGASEAHPDWPFQIGYSLSFRICETFHQTVLDNTNDRQQLFALYSPQEIDRMAAAYDAFLASAD